MKLAIKQLNGMIPQKEIVLGDWVYFCGNDVITTDQILAMFNFDPIYHTWNGLQEPMSSFRLSRLSDGYMFTYNAKVTGKQALNYAKVGDVLWYACPKYGSENKAIKIGYDKWLLIRDVK